MLSAILKDRLQVVKALVGMRIKHYIIIVRYSNAQMMDIGYLLQGVSPVKILLRKLIYELTSK